MRVGFTTRIIIIIYVLFAVPSFADKNSGQVKFERNDKVLTWQTNNNGTYSINDNVNVSFQNNLSTNLNMTTGKGTKDRWYDTVCNKAELGYTLSKNVDLTIVAKEDWYKDTMSKFGTSLTTVSYESDLWYRPSKNTALNAGISQIDDRRFDNIDKGTNARGEMDYKQEITHNTDIALRVKGQRSNLKRTNDFSQIEGEIAYDNDLGRIKLNLSDYRDTRGYFSDIDRKQLEERDRLDKGATLSFERGDFNNVSSEMALEVTMNLSRKYILDSANDNSKSSKYKNNSRGRLSDVHVGMGRGFGKRMGVLWEVDYSKNANGIERLIRRRTQTDVATKSSLAIGVGKADSIVIVGMIKRTRIDTPVKASNDRDELKTETGILYTRTINSHFQTTLDFRFLGTHYVDIFIPQTSQNKWVKTYILSPSLTYSPLRSFSINHMVNLYANYIKYDFDSKFDPRSNVSRKVSSETWMDIATSSKTRMKLGFMIENNDYGNLTAQGKKIPAEEGINRFGDVSIEYIFTDWLSVRPQYIYSVRRDWSYRGDVRSVLRREVDQTFGLSCDLFKRENGSILLEAQRVVRVTERFPTQIRNYINMTLTYGF